MKNISCSFRTHSRNARTAAQEYVNGQPPEDALRFAAVSGMMDLFHSVRQNPNLSMELFDEQQGLLTIIANSGIDAALWLIDHAQEQGLNLDRRDTYIWTGKEKWHTEHLGLDGHLDYKDRLHWQQGDYLRNTALILSLKKGWDHVSATDQRGAFLSPAGKAPKTKMGRVAEALLRNGANPDIQDGCGNTALHIAMLHRDVRPVRALRAAGARSDLRNNAGLLPVDMLDVRYDDINPFLYQQTGNDVNCYIFTLKSRQEWSRAGADVRQALQNPPPVNKPQGDTGFKPPACGL